jgi:hypothetical protein
MEYQSTIRIESQTCPGVAFCLYKPSYGRVLEFDRENARYREAARKINTENRELQEDREAERKAWFEAQAVKLSDLKSKDEDGDAKEIARIETGLEYERLLELVPRTTTDEQRKELADKFVALEDQEKDVFRMDPELLEKLRNLREKSDSLVASEYNLPRLRWGLDKIENLSINGKPATAESLVQDGPIDLVREIVTKIDEISGMSQEQLRNFELPSSSEEAERKAETTTTANAA